MKFAASIFQKHRRSANRTEVRFGAWPTLLASVVIFACCAFCFCDVFYGWPKTWARNCYGYGIFLGPAMAVLTVRDFWRTPRDIRLMAAALFGSAGFGLLCYTTYLVIHRVGRSV